MRVPHRQIPEAGVMIRLAKPFANLDFVNAVQLALGGIDLKVKTLLP
jgi:hypothetical protein